MARLIRTGLIWLVIFGLAAAAYVHFRDYVRRHPQDVPWTELRLTDPVGAFTLHKLAALSADTPQCRTLLREAGAGDVAAPARLAGPDCGYEGGMRLVPAAGEPPLAPAGVVTSCPVAAAMDIFEREVLQPAAREHLDSRVVQIDHAGSYSCRRLYGRAEGPFSEHAHANAIDLVGFRLTDGERVNVLRDWHPPGPKGRFLREVRDGACRLFATVLSPEYNQAHADHLHLDQAERGQMGFGVCR